MVAATTSLAQDSPAGRLIEKGDHSRIDTAKQVLVRTSEEWTALWRQHAPDRAKPAIDFSKEIVVGLFMGSRPSAGFAITLVATIVAKGALVVQYREIVPPRDAIAAQVITMPFHFVAIPRATVTDVKFEKLP